MKPFLLIGLPELIPSHDLTRLVTQPEEATLDLLNYAAESAMAAKKGFEVLSKLSAKDAFCQGSHESWLKNVKDCLKATIFTGITIATVKKAVEGMEKDEKLKIKAERFETMDELSRTAEKAMDLVSDGRWTIIDGDRPISEIHEDVLRAAGVK